MSPLTDQRPLQVKYENVDVGKRVYMPGPHRVRTAGPLSARGRLQRQGHLHPRGRHRGLGFRFRSAARFQPAEEILERSANVARSQE